MHALHSLHPCTRPVRVSLVSLSAALLVALAACNPDGGSSGGGTELEFRGEQPLLPGLDLDSGWLPEGSPVAVRTTMSASGAVTVVGHARADGDVLNPVAGSGSLAIEGGLALEVSARIDAGGLSYEDVVQSFDYGIAAESIAFEPFAIDVPASLSTTLPAAELGSVPIPGAPGATLVFSVTGGELVTTFAGTCAAALGGFAQYAGTLTMGGTLTAAATVEIDIPFVLTESYGPFEIDLPIPEIETAMDLGTLDASSGAPVADMGVCSGAGGPTSGASNAGDDDDDGDTGSDDDAAGSDAEGDDSGTGSATTATTATDDGDTGNDESGAPIDEDPDYPSPLDGDCAIGTIAVTVDGVDGGVCSPACGDDDSCPSGATGNATGLCAFNPQSSNNDCFSDIDCVDTGVPGEVCFAEGGFCSLPPSQCLLVCDATHACPDSMTCDQGACFYIQ